MTPISIEVLRRSAEEYVAAEPGRSGVPDWWRKPLLTAAPVDGRFNALRIIAADDHLHPRDLLPTVRSVVVFFVPFKADLVRENRQGDRPCRNWGLAYVQTNDLIGRLGRALGELLETGGFRCGLMPATHNFSEDRLMARWSHKHLGHLANLGRFGTHHMLITPAGCAGRLGSLVTEAALGDHPLIETREACLVKAGGTCGRCVAACPVEALDPGGFRRRRCWDRLKENRAAVDGLADMPGSTHVCGKCLAMMPCSFGNPMSRREPADR